MKPTLPENLNPFPLPVGQIATRKWLVKKGFNAHKLDNKVKSGKLKVLTKGVYTHPDLKLSWQSLAVSLPEMLSYPVAVGGLTALNLQGLAQYIRSGPQQLIDFYSPTPCPNWVKTLFNQLDTTTIAWHSTKRLWKNGWPEGVQLIESIWMETVPSLFYSSQEQAILELLMSVPDRISFEHADQIMQGLTQLSPGKVTSLLKNCINVKVKRLFFWLADRHQYTWRKKLDIDNFDLGSGKRVIVKGGKLDKTYLITVPESLTHEYV